MANKITTSFEFKEQGDGLKTIAKDLETAENKGKAAAAALSALADEIKVEMEQAEAAAEALASALGPELVAKLEQGGSSVNELMGHFQRLGLTFEDIKGEADALAGTVKKFDDLGKPLGSAKSGIDDVTQSSRGANSALANMVGNTAQDLGTLGGVAGSAGVAIGQMAEYASDATLGGEKLTSALGNMAKVAGPIAGIALAVSAVSDIMGEAKARAEAAAESQERWTEALKDGGSVADDVAKRFAESGEVMLRISPQLRQSLDFAPKEGGLKGFFNIFDSGNKDIVDMTDVLYDAGISVEQLTRAAAGGTMAQQRFRDGVKATSLSGDDQKLVIGLLEQQVGDYQKALDNQARFKAVFDPVTESADLNYRSLIAVGEAHQEAQRRAEVHDEAMKNSGHTAEDYAAALTGLGEHALAEKAAADDRAADAADRHRKAVDAVTDAMEAQLDASLDLVGGDIAVRNAQRRAAESAEELNTVLEDQETAHGEAAAAIDAAADSQLDAARAAADYRAKQMEANGQTVDGKVQAQLYEEELRKVASQLDGPLRAALDGYIAELDNLDGRTVTTSIVLNRPGRVGDFAAPVFGGKFHSGGMVPGPPGAERMILAKGGEQVLTPEQQRSGGAGGDVHLGPFYITANDSESVFDKLAREVRTKGPGPVRRALGID